MCNQTVRVSPILFLILAEYTSQGCATTRGLDTAPSRRAYDKNSQTPYRPTRGSNSEGRLLPHKQSRTSVTSIYASTVGRER